jgi:hypothetical protein
MFKLRCKLRGGASREILYDAQKRSNHIGMNCSAAGTSGRLRALVPMGLMDPGLNTTDGD